MMSRARRSGATRGKDTTWFREQIARQIDPPVDTEIRLRSAEREVERLRKAAIGQACRDQRLGGQRRRTDRAFRSWEPRLAWHLRTHHGIEISETRSNGWTTYRGADGTYLGPWRMDDLHEETHGRIEAG